MSRRITRAKTKIQAARIPYRVPSREDLPARVTGVLTVLYLIFNEGYLASDPEQKAVRGDLTAEAIRLTRLVRDLMPGDGEVVGLLALMLLTEARRTARMSAGGELVALGDQDRGAWDRELIAEGHALVRARLAAGQPPGGSRSRPRSTPSTPTPATSATPTGRRSSRSTTSSWSSTARRSSGSTGRSRSPSSTAPRWRWPRSTACRSRATTSSTPPAPSCCAGWAAATRRGRRTAGPSSWLATRPRGPTSSAAATSWPGPEPRQPPPRPPPRPLGSNHSSGSWFTHATRYGRSRCQCSMTSSIPGAANSAPSASTSSTPN
jgi:hypothetical protein